MATDNDTLVPGYYLHFKGKMYKVLGVAVHTETEEEMVVYQLEYADRKLVVRPKKHFLQMVSIHGQVVPRFSFVRSLDVGGCRNGCECETHQGEKLA